MGTGPTIGPTISRRIYGYLRLAQMKKYLVCSIHHWDKRSFVDLLYKQLGSFHLGFQWHILGKISFFLVFVFFRLSGIRLFDFLIFERSFVDYKRVVACDHIFVYYLILTMLSFNHQWIFHLFQWKLYWISRIMVHQAARSSSGRCPWRGGRKTLPDILLF